MIDAQRELANLLDDLGLPSMTVDNIRRELTSMLTDVLRRVVANDNNQSGDTR